MTKSVEIEGKSFEELLTLLEQAVEELDGNSLTLEQSVDAYERSVAISAACEKILNDAELRIQEIDSRSPAADDQDEEVPF